MRVRFMNLSMSDKEQRREYIKAFDRILKSGMFIMGEELEYFEEAVKNYMQAEYCLGVSSGTDALILALKAYNIGYKDEVIVPDMSFIATANAVSQVGAKPIFCDIRDDFNIDTEAIAALITKKTKAIIAVHYGGKMADMQKLKKIAKEHNLTLIEDASQAFGAKFGAKMAGTLGHVGCFSLNPMKPLGALGEAGLISCSSKKIYKKLKALRYNGLNEKKECIYKSLNAKIDTLQASFLSIRLKELGASIQKREKVAEFYNKHLSQYLQTPQYEKNRRDAFFTYTVLVKHNERDKLFEYLTKKGIEVKINHLSMHQEPAYKDDTLQNCKHSIKISQQKLALPCHEKLTLSELKYIVKCIKKFYDAV